MMKTLLLAGLLVGAALVLVPTVSAYPNCDVSGGQWGVGVICAGGSGAFGVCALALYDTTNVRWAFPGYYVCF